MKNKDYHKELLKQIRDAEKTLTETSDESLMTRAYNFDHDVLHQLSCGYMYDVGYAIAIASDDSRYEVLIIRTKSRKRWAIVTLKVVLRIGSLYNKYEYTLVSKPVMCSTHEEANLVHRQIIKQLEDDNDEANE